MRDVAAAAFLVLLHVVLYRKILRLWFVYDDSSLFRILLETTPLEAWTAARVWPQQLFTPLMMSAFEAQFALFGLDAFPWYVVFLVIASLTSIAIYVAARQWLDVVPALIGAMIFVAGAPMCSLITQLSTVHYFIALTFGALAVIAWARGADVLSAALYFLSILAKEITVPLPLLLLFLPPRSKPHRVIPHAVALIVYFVWRRAVIGTFFGAYSWVIERDEWPRLALLLPWKVIRAVAGHNLTLGLILVAAMAIAMIGAPPSRRPFRRHPAGEETSRLEAGGTAGRMPALRLFAIAMLVAIGPIVPVSKDLHPRYAVAFWLAWSLAFAAATKRKAILIPVALLAIVVNRQEWGREIVLRQRMSDEAKFYFQMSPNDLLRLPATPPPVMREWNVVKTHLRQPLSGGYFYDDFYLCVNDVRGRKIWEFDPRLRTIVGVTPRIPALAARHCSAIRTNTPLTARLEFKSDVLRWDFGPWSDGRWSILLGDGREAWVMPRRDALNLPVVEVLTVRVRYDSPEGWTAYSPPIRVVEQTND